MSRTTLDDIYQFDDYLVSVDFDLIIPNLPGGGNAKAITVKCRTSALPGSSLEPVEIGLHGFVIKRPGRRVFPRQLPFTLYESGDMTSRDAIIGWMNACRGARTMAGVGSRAYRTTGDIIIYNDAGTIVRRVRMFGMWPEELSDSDLSGDSSNPMEVSGQLSYDTAEDVGV
jgi:hypothetical protein